MRGGYRGGLKRREAQRQKGMGAQDSEQLGDRKGQVLSLEAPCKGSPGVLLSAKCPNRCWQPAPSLWDSKCLRDNVPEAEFRGVSHA